jgi:putative CocE/NonD family hydrolase
VSDVYPDGRSILFISGIRRARYRESFAKPSLLVPGEIYKIAFDVGWMSHVFNRGHRIRVTVAGAGSDFTDANPNTGEAFTIGPPPRVAIAKNTIYHGGVRASRILAPRPD